MRFLNDLRHQDADFTNGLLTFRLETIEGGHNHVGGHSPLIGENAGVDGHRHRSPGMAQAVGNIGNRRTGGP